jgi:selenocysteine lyase/cysteine desulfurase
MSTSSAITSGLDSRFRLMLRRRTDQEFNYAAVLGLGAAVDYALAIGIPKIATRVRLQGDTIAMQCRGSTAMEL